ncbi:hypothetical protein L202_06890 [Cryptococcus amylolentus CBS 6039]|uniref:Uncharacterized protein n=2 Tax=Cryptococcus amylolentus TaxID=104669 RepID=A0A1E3HDW6_9TREE|nr:hypothetical protein L202_06890 [Cryptococcus amylolentus CBS 6039]ODN74514.1 hypothetical protein L202_06890 [Cryptococcus amylolentus CBS 6039]ODO01494.1 hypothetical protein I350_06314 [Cryptococcus amylolentus CBS 6273]
MGRLHTSGPRGNSYHVEAGPRFSGSFPLTPSVPTLLHGTQTAIEISSLITPVIYAASSVGYKGKRAPVDRLLRYASFSVLPGFAVGLVGPLAWDFEYWSGEKAEDPSATGRHRFAGTSAILGAVLVPAVFHKYAPIRVLITGGGSLGLGLGALGYTVAGYLKLHPYGLGGRWRHEE